MGVLAVHSGQMQAVVVVIAPIQRIVRQGRPTVIAVPVEAVGHGELVIRVAEVVAEEHAVVQPARLDVADGVLPALPAAHVHLDGNAPLALVRGEAVIPVIAAALRPLLQLLWEDEMDVLADDGELEAAGVQGLQLRHLTVGSRGVGAGRPRRRGYAPPRPALLHLIALRMDDEHAVMVGGEAALPPAVAVVIVTVDTGKGVGLFDQLTGGVLRVGGAVQLVGCNVVAVEVYGESIRLAVGQPVAGVAQINGDHKGEGLTVFTVPVAVLVAEPQEGFVVLRAPVGIQDVQLLQHIRQGSRGQGQFFFVVDDEGLVGVNDLGQHLRRDAHIINAADLVIAPVHAQLQPVAAVHIAQALDDHVLQGIAIPCAALAPAVVVADVIAVAVRVIAALPAAHGYGEGGEAVRLEHDALGLVAPDDLVAEVVVGVKVSDEDGRQLVGTLALHVVGIAHTEAVVGDVHGLGAALIVQKVQVEELGHAVASLGIAVADQLHALCTHQSGGVDLAAGIEVIQLIRRFDAGQPGAVHEVVVLTVHIAHADQVLVRVPPGDGQAAVVAGTGQADVNAGQVNHLRPHQLQRPLVDAVAVNHGVLFEALQRSQNIGSLALSHDTGVAVAVVMIGGEIHRVLRRGGGDAGVQQRGRIGQLPAAVGHMEAARCLVIGDADAAAAELRRVQTQRGHGRGRDTILGDIAVIRHFVVLVYRQILEKACVVRIVIPCDLVQLINASAIGVRPCPHPDAGICLLAVAAVQADIALKVIPVGCHIVPADAAKLDGVAGGGYAVIGEQLDLAVAEAGLPVGNAVHKGEAASQLVGGDGLGHIVEGVYHKLLPHLDGQDDQLLAENGATVVAPDDGDEMLVEGIRGRDGRLTIDPVHRAHRHTAAQPADAVIHVEIGRVYMIALVDDRRGAAVEAEILRAGVFALGGHSDLQIQRVAVR